MVGVHVQGVEVEPLGLDLGALGHLPAQTDEMVLDALDQRGQRVPGAGRSAVVGQGDVNGFSGQHSHVAGLPLDLGGDVRYVGNRAGSFDNSLQLADYELVDIYATYHLNKTLDVTGRINNLLDKTYVSWADTNYPTEVILGRPRFFEMDLHAGF